MKYVRVNDHDMAYIEVGHGRPIICVHGSFNDFRCWSPLLGPLLNKHRVIALSLRHYFPEQWDGRGGRFTIAQHVVDIVVDASFAETANVGMSTDPDGIPASAEKIGVVDLDGGLKRFVEGINGEGTWAQIPQAVKQELRDNARTLLGQLNEKRQPYRRAEAEAITIPTLFILGEKTPGNLPIILSALARAVPRSKTVVILRAGHFMMRHEPVATSEAILDFLRE